MINVTKTFLPPFEEYAEVLKPAWDKGWVTNNGELVRELESKLRQYLNVSNLLFCNNGTMALQLALKALHIKGEVITTPFSYVATTGAILWEHCTPVFVDIDPNNFCIDPAKIEAAITHKTTAILATHVFGQACDIDAIQEVAGKYHLKVIYDGAHAFGTKYKGQPVFNFGDVSTCSFHATKIFHTVEGGCVIANDTALAHTMRLQHQFGHIGDEHFCMGINGKNSELHAAMGLCNLRYIDMILQRRRQQWNDYRDLLRGAALQILHIKDDESFNYSYFPVVFASERSLLAALEVLKENRIFPRRYFYPSLNQLSYINSPALPISESIAERVLCLPLYHELSQDEQANIIRLVLQPDKPTAG
jgi:dTDP-4-amino-4,6-dideoxygalactose transaminase